MQTQPPGDDLTQVPVDLDILVESLDGDSYNEGAWLDLETGDIWVEHEFEPNASTPWIPVTPQGSQAAYGDMVDFAASVSDERLRDLLMVALDGPGAFRRFKDVLGRDSSELDSWVRFSDERGCQRATEWLAEAGYRPVEKVK